MSIGLVSYAFVLAVEETKGTGIDPTGGLLSYGVLGIVVVCLITGLLVPGYLYKKTEAENDRLRKLIDEKVYPAVEGSTNASREATETMRDVVNTLALYQAQQVTQNMRPVPRPRPRKKP